MPSLTLDKEAPGGRPLVLVDVRPSLYQQPHYANNVPHKVPSAAIVFLVDTGATETVIDETVIVSWALLKRQPKLVQHGGLPAILGYSYDLALRLAPKSAQGGWYLGAFAVATEPASTFSGRPFRGLIGMDLLLGTRLLFDLPSGGFELGWT